MTEIDGQGDLLALLEREEEDGWVEFQCFECGNEWWKTTPPEEWAKEEARHLNGNTNYEYVGCWNSRMRSRYIPGIHKQFKHNDPLPGQVAAWVRHYVLMRWEIAAMRGNPEAPKHIQQLEEWLRWWERSWFDGTPEREQRLRMQEAGHDFNKELGENND